MKKDYLLPSPILSEYIDRYWTWESNNNESIILPHIFPGTGVEFMFHYKDSFKNFPKSHILCPRNNSEYVLEQNGSIGFISVRFKSWAFPYFSKIPTDQLVNQVIDAHEIWPVKGKKVEEEIGSAANFYERTVILNTFFESLLKKDINQNLDIDWAINCLYYNYNNININELISETEMSTRSFQRKFKSSVGISAKAFQKITRFQTIYKRSLLHKKYPSIDSILKAGYYDQAHFNKDVNSLTGSNPTAVISDINFLAHFYNTSIHK